MTPSRDEAARAASGAASGPDLSRLVHRMQANGHGVCVNCGREVGKPHADWLCDAYALARKHLWDHLTDGRFHDKCFACQQRRRHGGCGLEALPVTSK